MAKLMYSATVSLDGFGRRTFGGDDPYKGVADREGKPFGGGWEGQQFVLTQHPPDVAVPGVTFVRDLDTAVAEAKAAAGDKYVNVLGASTAMQCLDAGVLDEIFVSFVPAMLGDGVPLFARPGGANVSLERLSVTEAPQATNLRFRVVR
jgi:dihydrofolate reductase